MSVIRAACTVLATNPGNACAKKAGAVFFATKISIFAQTTSLAAMVERVSTPDKAVIRAAALRDSMVPTAKYQWTTAPGTLATTAEPAFLKDLTTFALVRLASVVPAVMFSPKPAKKIRAEMAVPVQILRTATSAHVGSVIQAKTVNNKRTFAHQTLATTMVPVCESEKIIGVNALQDLLV